MTVRKISEHEEQVKLVQWLKRNHKELRFFAVPNAAKRSYKLSAIMKAEGLCPGVPDLMIPALHLFIEMKSLVGVVSDDQKDWIEYLNSIGYTARVCYGFEQAKELIEGLL